MAKPDDAFLDLPEQVLMAFAAPASGWARERTALSAEGTRDIRSLLAGRLQPAQSEQLLPYLNYVLGQAVEVAAAHRRLIAEAKARDKISGRQRREPRKLGVRLRHDLCQLIDLIDDGQDLAAAVGKVCQKIQNDPILKRLVRMFLCERMSMSVADPLESAPREAAVYLPNLLEELKNSIDRFISRGRTEPALTVICRGFAGYYRAVTGRIPGRTYKVYEELDTGHGLEICRILAREMNAALPPEYQQAEPFDMTIPYRRAIAELRQET